MIMINDVIVFVAEIHLQFLSSCQHVLLIIKDNLYFADNI